jgi:aryl-alcohol dehydrogenase-like predicted oxidoreductase
MNWNGLRPRVRYVGCGWSTDSLVNARFFAEGGHCGAAQIEFNIFGGNPDVVKFCRSRDLRVLCRSPQAGACARPIIYFFYSRCISQAVCL